MQIHNDYDNILIYENIWRELIFIPRHRFADTLSMNIPAASQLL